MSFAPGVSGRGRGPERRRKDRISPDLPINITPTKIA